MTIRTSVLFTALSWVAAAQLLGCAKSSPNANDTSTGDTDDEAAPSQCDPGDTRECVGSGACKGGQRCEDDGKWGECDCGGDGSADSPPSDSSDSGATLTPAGPSGSGSSDVAGGQATATPPTSSQPTSNATTDDGPAGGPPTTTSSTEASPSTTESANVDAGIGAPSGSTPEAGETSSLPQDPIALPGGVNDVPLLPPGYALSEPLIIEEWDGIRNSAVTPLPSTQSWYNLRFGHADHGIVSTDYQTEKPYLDDGRYCVTGEALPFAHYGDPVPGIHVRLSKNSELLTTDDLGVDLLSQSVVGLVFDLEGVPATGLVTLVIGPDSRDFANVAENGRHVIVFGTVADDEPPTWSIPNLPDDVTKLALSGPYTNAIAFTVHSYDLAEITEAYETAPFDFCISNIRLLLEKQ